jgi:hypothetical protein
MTTLMADAIKQQDFVKLASQIPYAQLIGIHCMPIGEHFILNCQSTRATWATLLYPQYMAA